MSENYLARWGGLFLLIGIVVGGLVACGGEDPIPLEEEATIQELCAAGCENIYDTCGNFLLNPNGVAMSRRGCRSSCEEQDMFRREEACMVDVQCEDSGEEMIQACLPEGTQIAHCAHLGLWPRDLELFEEEVLEIVNQVRSEGASCGTEGEFGPAGPLVMNEVLRCAARLHSEDMQERGYFAHEDPDGVGPSERATAAGYPGGAGENIAQGYPTAEAVMQGWMTSDGHCANIMRPGYTEIGVGLSEVGRYWTQKFGSR